MSMADTPTETAEPTLNIQKHIKYWLRCVKTLLPGAYQEQESSRILFGFFSLFSLDLLGDIRKFITEKEREDFIAFVYSCQHPDGGFRAFPGSDFGSIRKTTENERWDPASVAGTYFALGCLVLLGDNLSRVDRLKTLVWVANLQREDGSFGELAAGSTGMVEGGQDVRFCFLAALICSILGEEPSSKLNTEKYINAPALIDFILKSQAYDGGIARRPKCESHAGSTYCAVSILKLLEVMPARKERAHASSQAIFEAEQDLLHWLAMRQTKMQEDYQNADVFENDIDTEDEVSSGVDDAPVQEETKIANEAAFAVLKATPALPPLYLSFESLDEHPKDSIQGLNGRTNKPADTCYSFWAGASLAILEHTDFIDTTVNRRYLLGKTQHIVGGFGKFPGDPPDILHAALALACLSIHGESGLKPIDPILCISLEAKNRLDAVPWRRNGG